MMSNIMYAYQKYGIEVGQEYMAADGSPTTLTVLDVDTYADSSDVIVLNHTNGLEQRIDAFKLAMVRYVLVKD